MPADLSERYAALLESPDPRVREVARRQLDALRRTARHREADQDQAAPVGDSDLVRRIESMVGRLHDRSSGMAEGACPWHASRSGRCLVVFPGGHRWWCRDCKRGGDVASWVAMVEGIRYGEARRRLGLAVNRRAVRRPTISIEVAV